MTEPTDYFLEIEARFAERRGTPFILSAKDWVLMKKWKEEGVPIAVVLEALDTVFARNEESGRRRVISSLSYCRHAVKELWEERKDLQVGAQGEAVEADTVALLVRLAEDLTAVPSPVAQEIAMSVAALKGSVPEIEERLIELEHDLVERLLASLSAEETTALRTEIARTLGDTSRLDPATRSRTEEANLRRIVRDRFALPRLTLFR